MFRGGSFSSLRMLDRGVVQKAFRIILAQEFWIGFKGVDTSRDLADLVGRYYSSFFLHRNDNTDRSPIAR